MNISDNRKRAARAALFFYSVGFDHFLKYYPFFLKIFPNDGMDYQCTMNALDGSEFEYTMADNE